RFSTAEGTRAALKPARPAGIRTTGLASLDGSGQHSDESAGLAAPVGGLHLRMPGAVQGGRLRMGSIRLRALRRGLGTAVHRRRSDLGVPRRVLDEGGSGRDPRDRRWPLSGAREAIRRAGAPRESSSRRHRLRRGDQRARHLRKRWGEDARDLSRRGRVRAARGEARHACVPGRLMSKSAKRVFKIVGIAVLGLATWGIGSLIAGGAAIGSAIGGGIAVGSLSVSFSTLVTVGLAAL